MNPTPTLVCTARFTAAHHRWIVSLTLGGLVLAGCDPAASKGRAGTSSNDPTGTAAPATAAAPNAAPNAVQNAVQNPPVTPGQLQPLARPLTRATLSDTGAGSDAAPAAGGPRVGWALPAGLVPTDLVGAVGFDRPMVPLSQVDDDVQVAWLRFSPAISVRARWVDTRTLRFAATSPLPRGSSWTLTIQGARDLAGAVQTQPHTAKFHTARLALLQSEPRNKADGVGRRHVVALRFDQRVSEAAVRRATSVRAGVAKQTTGAPGASGRAATPRPTLSEQVAHTVTVPDASALVAALRHTGRRYVFGLNLEKPDPEALKRLAGTVAVVRFVGAVRGGKVWAHNSNVEIAVAGTLRGEDGPRPLGNTAHVRYAVHGPMQYLGAQCLNDCRPDDWRPLRLKFSTGVALPKTKAERAALVTVTPAIANFTWSCWGRSCSVGGDLRPATRYSLRVASRLSDEHGQRLGRDVTATFTTGDRRPRLQVETEGSVLERSEAPFELGVTERNHHGLRLQLKRLTDADIQRWVAARGASELDFVAFEVDRAVADGALNADRLLRLDVGKELKFTGPALVYARIQAAAPVGANHKPSTRAPVKPAVSRVLQITDLNPHLRRWSSGGLLWLTSLSGGGAVAGATARLIDTKTGERWRGTTDAEGLARISVPVTASKGGRVYLLVEKANDKAVLRPDWPTRVRGHVAEASPLRHVLFTEKGLYKPGETAHLKGVLRRLGVKGLALPGKGAVLVELRTPAGKVAVSKAVALNELGTFHADLALPSAGPYGTWDVNATWTDNGQPYAMRTSLNVAVYRPAQFTVDIRLTAAHVVQGDEITAKLSGTWLSGGEMSGARAQLDVTSVGGTYRPAGWQGWQFGLNTWEPEKSVPKALRHEARAVLDAKGAWQPTVLARSGHTQPVRVLAEATLTGPSGSVGNASSSLWLHPAALTVGLKVDRTFFKAGDTVDLQAMALDLSARPTAARTLQVTVVQRSYKRIRAQRIGGEWDWETVTVDRPVATCAVDGKTPCQARLDKAGAYVARAEATDVAGRSSVATLGLWAAGSGAVDWHPDAEQTPLLKAERDVWRVGENARLLIQNPWPGATGMLTVDRGGVRTVRLLPLPNAVHTIEVPITQDLQPSCHVSLIVFRGRQTPGVVARLDTGGPMMRAAAVQLRVDNSAHALDVRVKAEKARYRPGDTVELALDVYSAGGKPRFAEVAVLVVDEGVLQLTGYQTPNPMQTLYEPQTHGVEDHSLIGQLVRKRVREAKGAPGGGGADGAPLVRGDFRDVAWYAPAVMTDKRGHAVVRFTLPDNVTTFRAMAVAVSGAEDFGAGDTSLLVGKPLMVQLRPPRFAELGDQFELSASVRNRSEKLVAVKLNLSVKGTAITATGPISQAVSVPAGEAREVRFAVKGALLGVSELQVDAVAGSERDAVVRKLTVVDRAPHDVMAVYGATDTDVIEAIVRPVGGRAGGLEVEVASTGLTGVTGGIDALIDYPFGCAEQTASRLLALLEVGPLQTNLGLLKARDRAAIDAKIVAAASRLLSMRASWPRGLFRPWPGSRSRTDVLVSAWALRVLHHASSRGVAVEKAVFTEGAASLHKHLARRRRPGSEVDRLEQAVVLAALSHLGAPSTGYIAELWGTRATLSFMARLHLADALAYSGTAGDAERAAELVAQAMASLRVEGSYAVLPAAAATGAGVWQAGPRASGMLLALVVKTTPQHPLARRLARGLLREQRGGHWGTTQGNAWALLGLGAYYRAAEATPPTFKYAVFAGQQRLGDGQMSGRKGDLTDVQRLFQIGQDQLQAGGLTAVQIRRSGSGRMYYGLRYDVVDPVGSSAAHNAGLVVRRRVFSVDGEPVHGALPRGAYAVVTLTTWSGEARRQVAISDPLPGGLEVVDFDLANPPKTLAHRLHQLGSADGPWQHREVTPHEVRFFADKLSAGQHTWRYVVRAATRGRWTWPGTQAQEMYDREVWGRAAASSVEVGG